MTRRLEEMFDLPPSDDVERTGTDMTVPESTEQDTSKDMPARIDAALPEIADIMKNMQDYENVSNEALRAFEKIMSQGESAEDKHAAEIYNAAARMLETALKGSEVKDKKKLKMIELQLKKSRLDYEIARDLKDKDDAGDGDDQTYMVGNRNKIIEATIREIGKSEDDNDK